jgi:hypothetical protein
MGTMRNIAQCQELGSDWGTLKPTVVNTRNRGTTEIADPPLPTLIFETF